MNSSLSHSTCLCMTAGRHLAPRSYTLNLNRQQIPILLYCRQLQVANHDIVHFNALKMRIATYPYLYNKYVLPYLSPVAQGLTQEPEEKPQQQAIASIFLSDSDFPVLGADVSSTKEKKSKIRDATQKKDSATVFREAYHAQLREVHGANMRAVEAVVQDEEELAGRRRNRVLDQDSVNSLMEDVIRDIAAEGELVTKEKVREKKDTFLIIDIALTRASRWRA